MRRLAMTKGAARSLDAIVGGFPMSVAQKLTQALALDGGHLFLEPPEVGNRLVGRIGTPGLKAGLGLD